MKKEADKRKNILFTSSFSSLEGGGQRSLLLILKYLNKSRFMPFLAVPQEGELSGEASKVGVKVFAVPFPKIRSVNVFSFFYHLMRLYRIVKENNIDIIHTESPRETFYAYLIKKIIGVRVVMHLRVDEKSLWLDKKLYQFADKLIAVSNAVKVSRFKEIDKMKKVEVVYNSVELDIFHTEKVKNKDTNTLWIGYFGRIHRRKGIEVLIKAINALDLDIILLVMGSGDEKYLSELKSMAAKDRVIFKPYKQDARDYIAKADVVVLPSILGEGLSRIVLEAMSLGKVVISSDLDANKEAMGENMKEFIFPIGDADKLSQIIRMIVENRDVLLEKKMLVRKRAEELFDVKKNTKRIEEIYEKLLS